MIQAGGGTSHSGICKLINSIRNKEEVWQWWRKSVIVPIYKNENECRTTVKSQFKGSAFYTFLHLRYILCWPSQSSICLMYYFPQFNIS
jgi:hypothetical protein